MKPCAAVIGTGLGGIASAIRLASAGWHVCVFEKNEAPGGKLREVRLQGYRWDTGPSLLTLPDVVDSLFSAAGEDRREHLEFDRIDPICRYFWPGRPRVDARQATEEMSAAIAKLSTADAKRFPEFMAYAKRIYDTAAEPFLRSPIHEWKKVATLANLRRLRHFANLDFGRTMQAGIRRFFSDPAVLQLFGRYATYNGSSPFRTPATLNLIPYVEHGLGSYYVRGGMYRLVEALENVALSRGVEFRYDAPVERIEHEGGCATGIRTAEGFTPAQAVICNQDVVTAHARLLPDLKRTARRLARLEPSSAGYVFLWGVRNRHEELGHHNVFFSRDYRQEFADIFERGELPEDPTLYVAVTSKREPDHAPAGGENWFVLVNAPPLRTDGRSMPEVDVLRNRIFRKLRMHDLDPAKHIECETVLTPRDFAERDFSNRGSIYGVSSNGWWSAFHRPPNRSRDLKGLYFVGGSTHPGGGIPLVLLSAEIVSDLLAENMGESARIQSMPITYPVAKP